MLYDITHNKAGFLVKHKALEKNQFINALKTKLPSNSYNRIVKTIEEGLDVLVADGKNSTKLTWTKNGALLGHKSTLPKKHIDHLWQKVIESVGDGKNCLKTVGSLLRYCIAKRQETWMLYMRDTEEVDPDTGKNIHVSEYWIKKDFFNNRSSGGTGYSLQDIAKKYNNKA